MVNYEMMFNSPRLEGNRKLSGHRSLGLIYIFKESVLPENQEFWRIEGYPHSSFFLSIVKQIHLPSMFSLPTDSISTQVLDISHGRYFLQVAG